MGPKKRRIDLMLGRISASLCEKLKCVHVFLRSPGDRHGKYIISRGYKSRSCEC